MSFIYSRALVEAFSEANCLGTVPSAPLSGSPTPNPSWWHDRTMEVSRHSRYGMTCRPLTDDRGAALLTWWLAGFHAKTSALPERAQASPESVRGSGPTWRASLAKFDPDSSSWKTVQLSLLGDSELSSVTWPRSGMTADGQCWELPTLERRTSEIGYGFWPTPVASDTSMRSKKYAQGGTPLSLAVRVRTFGLAQDADTSSTMIDSASMDARIAKVQTFPTPTVNDSRSSTLPKSQICRDNLPGHLLRLGEQPGGQLNPNWVEWLMGWPIGWTALKPSETAKSPSAPQPHGESLEGLEA